MSKKLIAVVVAVLLAAVPASLAQARPGGKGKGPKVERKLAKELERAAKRAKKAKRARKAKKAAYVARGTVAAVDAGAQTVTVSIPDRKGATNRRARAWRGTDVTFDVSGAKLRVRDRNGDGSRDLADVAAGDLAGVLCKLPRVLGEGDVQPFAAKRVVVRRKPAPEPVPAPEPDPEPELEPVP